MFVGYQQILANNQVKTVAQLTVPVSALAAQIQADTQNIRYTCDGTTAPTNNSGMVLLTTQPPLSITIEDLRNIKFIQSSGGAGNLNIHYLGARL